MRRTVRANLAASAHASARPRSESARAPSTGPAQSAQPDLFRQPSQTCLVSPASPASPGRHNQLAQVLLHCEELLRQYCFEGIWRLPASMEARAGRLNRWLDHCAACKQSRPGPDAAKAEAAQ